MKNSTRWGLTTFALGISCGVLGHYLPIGTSIGAVLFMSVLFGLFGSLAISEND